MDRLRSFIFINNTFRILSLRYSTGIEILIDHLHMKHPTSNLTSQVFFPFFVLFCFVLLLINKRLNVTGTTVQ